MLVVSSSYTILIMIMSIILIGISFGIFMANKFQKKQDKKYEDCLNIIKEKGDVSLNLKMSLTKEEINNVDSKINVDKLMKNLYDTYLKFEKKVKDRNIDFDDILTDKLKTYYINKLEGFKLRKYREVLDGIELVGYSITEFKEKSLKFRISINCFSYKEKDGEIISGSNLKKSNIVLIVGYEKIKNKWLISDYDRVFEKLND